MVLSVIVKYPYIYNPLLISKSQQAHSFIHVPECVSAQRTMGLTQSSGWHAACAVALRNSECSFYHKWEHRWERCHPVLVGRAIGVLMRLTVAQHLWCSVPSLCIFTTVKCFAQCGFAYQLLSQSLRLWRSVFLFPIYWFLLQEFKHT